MKKIRTTKKAIKKVGTVYDADSMWQFAWTYIRTVIDTAREPFLILDGDLRVMSANRTFYSFFQVTKKATEGTLVYELGDGQWNIGSLRRLLEKILPKDTFLTDYRVDHEFPGIGKKIMLLNARSIYTSHSKKPILMLAMEDITKQKELEEKLRDYAVTLNTSLAARLTQLEERMPRRDEGQNG